ncbi:hypothetical protein PGT21_028666 [Puccinia graminis f. sp. tritici]|uniref:Uncharacterized protein n=1 Tax=Puccinia graminis f. sp. tritici TaxID=56615 RepID=A0A5B0Q6T2_PUCGR|nr:hypothetical protein PGT21_028666 [Puccinia graminis f. sp. tritici]
MAPCQQATPPSKSSTIINMARSVSSPASQKKGKRKLKESPARSSPSQNDDSPQIPQEEAEDEGDGLTKPADESSKDGPDGENRPPDQGSSTHGSVSGSTPESDSDEAPEVISIVAGKRQIKQREEEIDNFAKATARARRQANRVRDEKLKKNSKTRKTKIKTTGTEVDPEESSSSDEEKEDDSASTKPVPAAIPVNTKKYLDPSLFSSASHTLEKSKQASLARASEKSKLLNTRRKKQKKLENQDWKDLGNNTTVVHLSQTDHLNPAARPIAAANFVRNRLYTKPNRSAVKLPKATLAAKAEMGSRKSAIETTYSRRSLKPSLVFARSQG